MPGDVTFAQLGAVWGEPPGPPRELSPLEDWYQGILQVPLPEFTEGDLARSLQQRLYPREILPLAVDKVILNPLAGEKYEGELALALADLRPREWVEAVHALRKLLLHMGTLERQAASNESVREAIRKFRRLSDR